MAFYLLKECLSAGHYADIEVFEADDQAAIDQKIIAAKRGAPRKRFVVQATSAPTIAPIEPAPIIEIAAPVKKVRAKG